jgi:hypothetical protein
VSAPWGAAANVAGLNSAADEESVAVSADGLTLAFASNRSGGVGGLDLYLSTRAERNDPWGPAVAYVHRTADDEHQPSLTADGLELFFARAGSGDKDVWVSTRRLPTDPWSAPSPVTDVNTALDDGSPAVSADGTRLFVSRRMLGAASADWWTYRRGGAGQPWGLFRRVAEISSDTATEFTGHDDGDGFSFYFARTTGMFSTGIWRADRVHPRLRVPPVYLPVLNFPEPPPPTNVTLRRDPGNVGLIALGIDPLPPTAIPGIEGLLLTIPLLTVANAVHDANGIVLWTIPRLPPGVAPGLIAHFQGVSQDAGGQYFLSNRVLFRLEL